MIIQTIRPLANYHPDDSASCKCPSGGSGLLQMIIWRMRPLANDHPYDPATLTNDHLEGPASYKSITRHPVTLITSPRIQIQSRGPFQNNLFLLSKQVVGFLNSNLPLKTCFLNTIGLLMYYKLDLQKIRIYQSYQRSRYDSKGEDIHILFFLFFNCVLEPQNVLLLFLKEACCRKVKVFSKKRLLLLCQSLLKPI